MSKLKKWALVVLLRCRPLRVSIKVQHTIGLVILSVVALFLIFLIWLSIVV